MKKFNLLLAGILITSIVIFSQVTAQSIDEKIEKCVEKYVASGVSKDEAYERCKEIYNTGNQYEGDDSKDENVIFCAQDVRQCPDGSYVKRVPPKCEFELCPSGKKPIEPKPLIEPKPIDIKPVPSTTVKPVESEECIKKYIEQSIPEKEAVEKCKPEQTYYLLPSENIRFVVFPDECDKILKEVEELSKKLYEATSEKESIIKKIKELKEEYNKCKEREEDIKKLEKEKHELEIEEELEKTAINLLPLATSITQGVCEKVKALEETIKILDEQIKELEKLLQAGEDVGEKLKSLIEEREFLQERLDDAKKACEQGVKEEKEKPCVKAAELEILYEKLKEQLLSIVSEKDADRIKKEMEDILEQIRDLKKKCEKSDLEKEIEIKRENGEKKIKISELDKAVEIKIKSALENVPDQELSEALQEIENATKETIRELLSSIDVLNISGSDLVKEIRVTPLSVLMEGESMPVKKIELEVKKGGEDKEVKLEIDISGGTTKIREGNVEVESKTELEVKDVDGDGRQELVSAETQKVIKALPSEVEIKIKSKLGGADIEDVKLTDVKGERAVIYEVKIKKRGKLFGLLPLTAEIPHTAIVDASSGNIKDIQKPWWSFLFR